MTIKQIVTICHQFCIWTSQICPKLTDVKLSLRHWVGITHFIWR